MSRPEEIFHKMPDLKSVLREAALSFPPGYRWPKSVVFREAAIAVKDYRKVNRGEPIPDGDYLVHLGDYGDVRVSHGRVLDGSSFGL